MLKWERGYAMNSSTEASLQGERRPEEFGLPDMVQQYHSLFPLEDLHAAAEQPSAAFGVCSMLIRAVAPQLQGQAVTLRRLDSRQASSSATAIHYSGGVQCSPVEPVCTLNFSLSRVRKYTALLHDMLGGAEKVARIPKVKLSSRAVLISARQVPASIPERLPWHTTGEVVEAAPAASHL